MQHLFFGRWVALNNWENQLNLTLTHTKDQECCSDTASFGVGHAFWTNWTTLTSTGLDGMGRVKAWTGGTVRQTSSLTYLMLNDRWNSLRESSNWTDDDDMDMDLSWRTLVYTQSPHSSSKRAGNLVWQNWKSDLTDIIIIIWVEVEVFDFLLWFNKMIVASTSTAATADRAMAQAVWSSVMDASFELFGELNLTSFVERKPRSQSQTPARCALQPERAS